MTSGLWSVQATFPLAYTDVPTGMAHFVYNSANTLNISTINTTKTYIQVGKTDANAAGEMRYIAFGRKTVS